MADAFDIYDPNLAHIGDEAIAQRIVFHLADESAFRSERGEASHGVGRRAAGAFTGIVHRDDQLDRPELVDQGHHTLGDVVL